MKVVHVLNNILFPAEEDTTTAARVDALIAARDNVFALVDGALSSYKDGAAHNVNIARFVDPLMECAYIAEDCGEGFGDSACAFRGASGLAGVFGSYSGSGNLEHVTVMSCVCTAVNEFAKAFEAALQALGVPGDVDISVRRA